MPVSQGGFDNQYKPIPPTGTALEDELDRVVTSRILYRNLLWMSMMSTWRKAELYDQNEQIIRQAFSAYNGTAPYQWVTDPVDPDDPQALPRPVFNYGLAPRINETARLGRPRYQPQCRPNVDNASILTRLACRRMTNALLSDLYRMRWSTDADIGNFRMPVHGTWIIKSWWEQSWDDVVNTPVQGAQACPRNPGVQADKMMPGEPCDFMLAGKTMKPDEARNLGVALPSEREEPEEITHVDVQSCPQCEDHPPLVEYKPSQEEIDGGRKDKIGRPMGEARPIGRWTMRTCSPYDIFLPNLGVGIRYDNLREWTEVHVESLDWVALHYPEQADRVKRENQAKLMEYHPIGGSPALYGRGEAGALFNNHVRVKEFHQKPGMEKGPDGKFRLNKGRSIVIANGVKLMDADYLMPSLTQPGQFVERAWLELIPWEFRDGALFVYGMGMWDAMYGAQDTINDTMGQVQAVNQRLAVPVYVTDKSASLEMPEMQEGIPVRVMSMDIVPGRTVSDSFRLINNDAIADGVYRQVEMSIAFTNDVGARSEVDRGSVPSGVTAGTSIDQLRQESGTSREQREGRISAAMKRVYSHGARLKCALEVEPRTYHWEQDGKDQWERASGFDFQGQTEVEIEPEPKYDSAAAKSEKVQAIVTLLSDKLYTPEGKKIARLMDAPPELYENENLQEANAEREWESFIKDGKRPVVDPTMDAHDIHWDMHGQHCNDEQFFELEEKSGWDDALRILGASWLTDLDALAMQPPIPDQVLVSQATGQAAVIDPTTGQSPDPTAVPVPAPQAMQMGVIPQQQPQDLQDRIEAFWQQKLTLWGFQSPDAQSLAKVITWRAHDESHRLLAEMKQRAAMVQPILAAPGEQQTTAGTQITPGTPQDSIDGGHEALNAQSAAMVTQ